MCGIAGFVGSVDARLLRAMARIQAHRGPDDEALWLGEGVGLASRRLAIIDLVGGRQPFASEDGRYRLVFNGEIYNYRELRHELEAKGHRFVSASDGETIVHLYEEEGDAALERLEGMFALALWDRARRRLLLARDAMGIKPLYYRRSGERLSFASEAKALLLASDASPEADPEALAAYLAFLYVPSPRTAFRDIAKLRPGEALAFEDGRLRTWRHGAPIEPAGPPPADAGEAAEAVRAALVDGVSRHLVSDVPLGVFLSSGLDSSSIVASMRRLGVAALRTFTLDFAEESYSEAQGARLVAAAFETEHRTFRVEPGTVAELLPRLAWHLDEPLADASMANTYLVSRFARETVTVALTGIGGDELFFGYPRYVGVRLAAAYRRATPAWLRRAAAWAARALPDADRSDNPAGRVRRFLLAGPDGEAEAYLRWVSFWSGDELAGLLADGAAAASDPFRDHREAYAAAASTDPVERAMALDRATYLPDDLLVLADKMSMACSLELRVPFCDRRLLGLVRRLGSHVTGRGLRLKPLLRRAVAPWLPRELLARPKRGFSIPLGRWLRGPLREATEDLLAAPRLRRRGWIRPEAVRRLVDEHRRGRRDHADRLFALLMLELWHEAFVEDWPARRRAAFEAVDADRTVGAPR